MDAIRLVGVLALAVVLASGAGCASTAQDGAGAGVGASSERERAREQLCTRLLRDMRLYCKDGPRAEHGATSMECLSRRLEFERACF